MKKILFLNLLLTVFLPLLTYGHCQIPCGIYDDYARVQAMLEDTATIEKSTRLIMELSGKSDAQSQNQLVRWVMNKEEHAEKIISTISDYFLTQRINPDQKDYGVRLMKHHAVMLAAMRTKQEVNLKRVEELRKAVTELLQYYPAPEITHNHSYAVAAIK
ncbi:MAG: superoxide dismutase, Ni [Victivallales bacterium]|nr:superoxide dismutase, Ni [Victivallales bacterium]